MSLFAESPADFLRFLDDMLLKHKKLERASIDALVQERAQARLNKDFSRSDELRQQLTEMGIAVQDGPQGSEWEVQK